MQIDRETIVKLAHETLDRMAPDDYCREPYWTATDDELEHFAKLVAEHIREAEFKPDWNNYNQGRKDGAAEEREACAKVCDLMYDYGWLDAKRCATEIRARGEK